MAIDPLALRKIEIHGVPGTTSIPGLTVSDPGTLVTDRTGFITCTAVMKIRHDRANLMPDINSPHPVFGSILLMEHRALSLKGGFATAMCEYCGILGVSTTPVYQLFVGVGEEPISTHPKFKTDIGGTPVAPLNGARFRNVSNGTIVGVGLTPPVTTTTNIGYVFDSFEIMANETDLNEFAGVSSYLEVSQITWRKTWNTLSTIPVDVSTVGKIVTPEGFPPTISPRNWLDMGISVDYRPGINQLTHDWKASGLRKWNLIIYGT